MFPSVCLHENKLAFLLSLVLITDESLLSGYLPFPREVRLQEILCGLKIWMGTVETRTKGGCGRFIDLYAAD